MSDTVWVVMGQCGEYSDRIEWIVDAWRTEEQAKARVEMLTALPAKHGYTDGMRFRDAFQDKMRAIPDGDPNWGADYTGPATYGCQPVVVKP